MVVTEEIVNGEAYTVTTLDSGHIIRELKCDPIVPSPRRLLDKLEFKRRFTLAEHVAYRTALQSDITLQVFEDLFTAAPHISLDDPLTIQGVDYLVSIGVIIEARKEEILAGIE